MFGLFKNKKYDFNCPMCGRSYTIKLDLSQITDFDYPYLNNAGVIGKQPCEFCKTEMAVALTKHGDVKAFNEKWEVIQKEHEDKVDLVDEEITDLEMELEEDPNNENIKKKIKTLEAKKEKLEDSFEKKEEKYYDRQANWEEKWQNKLEKL